MSDIFTSIFWYENCDILIQMWLKYMRPSASMSWCLVKEHIVGIKYQFYSQLGGVV